MVTEGSEPDSDLGSCYARLAGDLVAYAAALAGPDAADDVVATALEGVVRRGPSGIRNLEAYLYRSVFNAAAGYWRSLGRRQRRERLVETAESVRETDPRPEVTEALLRLSPQQRAFVFLTYWEDRTVSSIATLAGVSEGTVKKQLARARRALAKELSP